MGKKAIKKAKSIVRRKDKKSNNEEQNNQDNEEVDNDFFVDDADDVDFNNNEDISDLEGSELDYDDDEHADSEVSEKKDDKEEKKIGFRLTKEKFKQIKEKVSLGNSYYISQAVVMFSKAINLKSEEDELAMLEEEDESNILAKKSYCTKIIRFCLKDLFSVLQVKPVKSVIKRHLGVIYQFLKKGESWDQSLITLAFSELLTNVNLVKMFKSYTEGLTKLAIKYWLLLDFEGSAICLGFLKEVAASGEFDYVLKGCYLGYLSQAKTMNESTYEKIELLQENIIYLLKQCDSESGYRNVFLFLRKLSIELNRTLTDKKWSSIKNIYNWQVINALILWFKVLNECYKNNLSSDYKLLAYPLIQITLGVLKLYYNANYIPLRLILLEKITELIKVSGVNVPLGFYILEIFESNIFCNYYKRNLTHANKLENLHSIDSSKFTRADKKRLKKKIDQKRKKAEEDNIKHSLTKVDKEFNPEDLPYTLKIKELKEYDVVFALLKASLKVLFKYMEAYSNTIYYCEFAWPLIVNLKKISKNIQEREFKEVLKSEIEVFEQNAVFIGEKREKINNPESIGLHDYKKIAKIENAMKKKFSDELPLSIHKKTFDRKDELDKEATISKKENKFIEIN